MVNTPQNLSSRRHHPPRPRPLRAYSPAAKKPISQMMHIWSTKSEILHISFAWRQTALRGVWAPLSSSNFCQAIHPRPHHAFWIGICTILVDRTQLSAVLIQFTTRFVVAVFASSWRVVEEVSTRFQNKSPVHSSEIVSTTDTQLTTTLCSSWHRWCECKSVVFKLNTSIDCLS